MSVRQAGKIPDIVSDRSEPISQIIKFLSDKTTNVSDRSEPI